MDKSRGATQALSDGRPYYSSYDQHYQALYRQGVKYWSAGPGMEGIVSSHMEMIEQYAGHLKGRPLLEMGCGEGYMGLVLSDAGYDYSGVDYSEDAVLKAKERAKELGKEVDFRAMDVFELSDDIKNKTYDVILDWACLCNFVMDDDRRTYYAIVQGLQAEQGVFILIHQPLEDDPLFDKEMNSIADWERIYSTSRGTG